MKNRETNQSLSLAGGVLIAATILLVCIVGALSYTLAGRAQTVPLRLSRAKTFELAQLAADVRTVTAAISYLLEPEPPSSAPDSPPAWNFSSALLLTQTSSSNRFALSRTNDLSPG